MTKKKTQEYVLIDSRTTPPLKIFAIVNGGKTITLKTNKRQEEFYFIKSQPEIAKGVIGLMQEAIKLLPKEGKND